MKECSWCKKQFESKSQKAKFCSTSCRVMNHRENGGNVVKPHQVKALYNEMMEVLGNLKIAAVAQPPVFDETKTKILLHDERLQYEQPTKPLKTLEQYVTLKRECDNEDDWAKLISEINEATNLTQRQKTLLINYS